MCTVLVFTCIQTSDTHIKTGSHAHTFKLTLAAIKERVCIPLEKPCRPHYTVKPPEDTNKHISRNSTRIWLPRVVVVDDEI